jgi:hypothetical protein
MQGGVKTMKRFFPSLILVSMLLVLVLGVSAVMADPGKDTPPFPVVTSTIHPCKYQYTEDTKIWDAGHSRHGRNIGQIAVGQTDDGMFQVRNMEVLNWDVNMMHYEGTVHGTAITEHTNLQTNEVIRFVGTTSGRLHAEFFDIPGLPEPLEVWFGEGKGIYHGEYPYEGLKVKSVWWQELCEPWPECIVQPAPECANDLPLPGEEVWPVVTYVESYIIESTGTWPPGE